MQVIDLKRLSFEQKTGKRPGVSTNQAVAALQHELPTDLFTGFVNDPVFLRVGMSLMPELKVPSHQQAVGLPKMTLSLPESDVPVSALSLRARR
jgi:hypothetical protein